MKRLQGKNAIVTGAAAGIGEAACRRFLSEGAAVLAVDLDETSLERACDPLRQAGLPCQPLVADVSRLSSCRKIVDTAEELLGQVDVLFNNVGVVHPGSLLEASEEDWNQALEINAKSMFRLTRRVLPGMLRRRSGSIVNMSSVAGLAGVADRGVYSVSKAAVIGLTLSLARDFVDQGIRVNCICPATVDSPSLRARIASAPDPVKARAAFLARQPMGRFGTAEEIAALAAYLASDESAYMTGQALVIDGGMTL